jgi:hypothetical protein
MLGLEVHPPRHRELELLAAALEDLDRVAVVHAGEGRLDERGQALPAGRVDVLLEERQVVGALGQERPVDRLQERLGQVGVGREVGERDLGLDHPELGEVAPGVGVLGAEGRPEGVDLAHRHAIGLDVELARHRQVGLLAEEVLVPVDAAGGGPRRVGGVEGRDPEHLAGALGVRRRDDRRMDPEEALLVEEPMDRHRQAVADPGSPRRSRWCVGAGGRPRAGTPSSGAWAASGRCRGRRPSPPPRPRWRAARPSGPCPGTPTTSPVTRTAQPVVRRPTVSAKPGSSAGATTWSGSKPEPSWTATKDTPGLGVASGADPSFDHRGGAHGDLARQDRCDRVLHGPGLIPRLRPAFLGRAGRAPRRPPRYSRPVVRPAGQRSLAGFTLRRAPRAPGVRRSVSRDRRWPARRARLLIVDPALVAEPAFAEALSSGTAALLGAFQHGRWSAPWWWPATARTW